MTQLWPEGLPIDVDTVKDRPIALRWQRRRLVRAVTDHWLIHDDWWHDEIWRHYFEVTTVDGLLCVVYRDLLTDRWYLERVYD
jgi:hypothetical protein